MTSDLDKGVACFARLRLASSGALERVACSANVDSVRKLVGRSQGAYSRRSSKYTPKRSSRLRIREYYLLLERGEGRLVVLCEAPSLLADGKCAVSCAVSRLHTDAAALEQAWVCSLVWENVLFAEHSALRAWCERAQATLVEAYDRTCTLTERDIRRFVYCRQRHFDIST